MKLVGHHSCGADKLPVAVRFPAGPRVRLKTVDPPKGNGLGQKNKIASGMSRSLWHAFSKTLVAVSISSPVTWHNVSWALIWPCGEAELVPLQTCRQG